MDNNKEELQKGVQDQLENTSKKVEKEIEEQKYSKKKKHSIVSTIVTILCILVSIGIIYICGTSIILFFSTEDNNVVTLSNNNPEFNGSYIKHGDYSIEKLDEEIYYLNEEIPIILTEWSITNNGDTKGYPAAYLISTQYKNEEEIELQDAENLLIQYDNVNDSSYWEDKFNMRYSNLDPNETKSFYTAFILYNKDEVVNNEWTDLSGI